MKRIAITAGALVLVFGAGGRAPAASSKGLSAGAASTFTDEAGMGVHS